MVPTDRAREIGPRLRTLLRQLEGLLSEQTPGDPRHFDRTFRIHATDYVLLLVGSSLDRVARRQAPHVVFRFMPNVAEDADLLREGRIDLAVGVYGHLPPEMRTKTLFDERLVCVLRKGHPALRRRLTLERYAALPHIQVAPRGRPGSVVDDALAAKGLERHISRIVPYFRSATELVSGTDDVLTVPERAARVLAPRHQLAIRELPLPLPSYRISAIWHPRHDAEPSHRWLRQVIDEVARPLR
jgi:DNA-binding transcriptional LysR family regulator